MRYAMLRSLIGNIVVWIVKLPGAGVTHRGCADSPRGVSKMMLFKVAAGVFTVTDVLPDAIVACPTAFPCTLTGSL